MTGEPIPYMRGGIISAMLSGWQGRGTPYTCLTTVWLTKEGGIKIAQTYSHIILQPGDKIRVQDDRGFSQIMVQDSSGKIITIMFPREFKVRLVAELLKNELDVTRITFMKKGTAVWFEEMMG